VISYLLQRLLTAVLTLFGMSVLIFVLLRVVPGDIVDIIFSSAGFVNPAAKAELAREMGLDRPVAIQYVRWLEDVAQGDLGKSYRYDVPAWKVVKPRIPVTVELAVLAILIAVALGVFTGVVSAARQDSALDYALRFFSLAGLSMPSFWLGMMIILALVSWAGWVPAMTYISPFQDLRAHILQFIFPALAVGYRGSALIMRITRSAMLEVMREDYIRTARAKGLRERPVIFGHALANAMLPIVTVIGFEFAFMIGGLVVTETVFNLPGVARYLVDAILWRDYPVAQNLVMLIAVAVVAVNLCVDLLYGYLDPRIRYGAG
jgi:peptide/nickel transport system permease protein